MQKNSFINRKFEYINIGVYKYIILLNVLVLFLIQSGFDSIYIYFSIIPNILFRGFNFYRLFTYMFVHSNWNHLIGNMIGLFFFGRAVENALGTKEFLLYYFISGIFSGLLSSILYLILGDFVILIGASGAIFSILLAFAVLYPDAKILLFFVIPIKAPLLVILYGGYELFSQIARLGGNISHLAHLFGLLGGYLYLRIRVKLDPIKVWKSS